MIRSLLLTLLVAVSIALAGVGASQARSGSAPVGPAAAAQDEAPADGGWVKAIRHVLDAVR